MFFGLLSAPDSGKPKVYRSAPSAARVRAAAGQGCRQLVRGAAQPSGCPVGLGVARNSAQLAQRLRQVGLQVGHRF